MPGYWHIHWHRLVFRAGLNDYVQCRCGHREIRGAGRYGRSPKDLRWIETGIRTPKPTTAPPGPGGCSGVEQSGQGYLGPHHHITFQLGA